MDKNRQERLKESRSMFRLLCLATSKDCMKGNTEKNQIARIGCKLARGIKELHSKQADMAGYRKA